MWLLAMMSHELKTPLAVMDNLFQEFGSIRMFGGAKDLDRLIADLDTEMKSEFGNANEKLLAEVEELSKEGLDAAHLQPRHEAILVSVELCENVLP